MAEFKNLHGISDESLMERVQNGDHEAFSMLVHRNAKMFYAAAYRMCSSADDAEDIVQDAFMKLWNNPGRWDAGRGAKFSTWFYRVVTNQAIDFMRRKKGAKEIDTFDRIMDESPGQGDILEEKERDAMLEKAVQSLPERQKTALNLCFYEGLSNKEAADIMGVGVKALESLLMRAKAGLRTELERCGMLSRDGEKRGQKYYG